MGESNGRSTARPTGLISIACLSIISIAVGILAPPRDTLLSCDVLPLASHPPLTEPSAGDGFADNAVYPTTRRPLLSAGVKLVGSWLGSNESTGALVSPWFQTDKPFYVMVSGYPDLPGNSLRIELRTAEEPPNIVPVRMRPAEAWLPREIPLPHGGRTYTVRVLAVDGSQGWGGWLGVSYPFTYRRNLAASGWALARIVLCLSLTIVLLLGPGLLVRTIARNPIWRSLALLPVPGMAYLTLCGLVVWATAGFFDAKKVALLLALPMAALFAFRALRRSAAPLIAAGERRVFGVVLLVAALAVAKASYSQGPAGELYGGTISRTLEAGDRPDSRISFHVVQLIATGTDPHSPAGAQNFKPWSFSHRGPLAGIITSLIPLLTGARVSLDMPDQPWEPFDSHGFAAYRIGMIVLSATALLILYGAAQELYGAPLAYQTLLIAALTPFVVHELYFTWPKMPAAALVLLSLFLIVERHPAWAGAGLGAAYLFHPLALFSLPPALFLVCVVPARMPARGWRECAKPMLAVLGPLAFAIAFWRIVNAGHFKQSGFLNYVFLSDGVRASGFVAWLQSRVRSLCNTLLPFYSWVHASGGKGVAAFFKQYWTTLPFGFGFAAFVPLTVFAAKAFQQARWMFSGTVIAPLAIFAVYWGFGSTGLLCEGLQAWLLVSLLCSVYCLNRGPIAATPGMRKTVAFLFSARAIEVLSMLFLPTIATSATLVSPYYKVLDGVLLAASCICVSGLALLSYRGLLNAAERVA